MTKLAVLIAVGVFAIAAPAGAVIPKVPGILVAGAIRVVRPTSMTVHVMKTGGRDTNFRRKVMLIRFDHETTIYVGGRRVKASKLRVGEYVSVRLKPDYAGGYIAKQVIVKPAP